MQTTSFRAVATMRSPHDGRSRAFGWPDPIGKLTDHAAPVAVVATLFAWIAVLVLRVRASTPRVTPGPHSARTTRCGTNCIGRSIL